MWILNYLLKFLNCLVMNAQHMVIYAALTTCVRFFLCILYLSCDYVHIFQICVNNSGSTDHRRLCSDLPPWSNFKKLYAHFLMAQTLLPN